jgi:hypothetical protein
MSRFHSMRRHRTCLISAGIATGALTFAVVREGRREVPPVARDQGASAKSRSAPHSRHFPFSGSDRPAAAGIDAASRLTINDVPKLARSPMDPELARILLARTKSEVKDIRHRAAVSSAILTALCAQGEIEEAWNLVEPGRGTVREAGIGAIFGNSAVSAPFLLGKLDTLAEPKDRARALEELIRSRAGGIASIDFAAIRLDSAQEKAAVVNALTAAINQQAKAKAGDPDAVRNLVEKSVKLFTDEKIDAASLARLMNNSDTRDPFYQWGLIDGLKETAVPEDLERLNSGLVRTMIRRDLERSMDLITSNAMTKHSQQVIERAVDLMYSIDSKKANDWVTTNLFRLDQITAQHVIASTAKVAVRNGELETALRWAERLDDSKARSEILGQSATADELPAPP